MPDPLTEVKSRLIDAIYAPGATKPVRDPYDAISLHAAVSNELWWIYAGRQMLPRRTIAPVRNRKNLPPFK